MSKDTLTHTTSSRRPFKQISFKERQLIESLYRKKTPVSQIAHVLGLHRSSIYRELKRGHVIHLDSELGKFSTYSADRAQDASSLALSARGPDLKTPPITPSPFPPFSYLSLEDVSLRRYPYRQAQAF